MKIGLLALCVMATLCVRAEAAAVSFSGSLISYVGAPPNDPLAFGLPETFVLNINTTGATINNGQIIFTGGSGRNFSLTGGTVSIVPGGAGTTSFTGMAINNPAVVGGFIGLDFNMAISDVNAVNQLLNFGGGIVMTGSFANSIGTYSGAVTAVPEPGTTTALVGLVLGAGVYRWRKRKTAGA